MNERNNIISYHNSIQIKTSSEYNIPSYHFHGDIHLLSKIKIANNLSPTFNTSHKHFKSLNSSNNLSFSSFRQTTHNSFKVSLLTPLVQSV